MKSTCYCLTTLALWGAVHAFGAPATITQAEKYFTVRDKATLASVTPDQLLGAADQHKGRLVEIRGTVSGVVERQDGGKSFVIATEDQVYTVDSTADLPAGVFDMQAQIRVLVRGVSDAGGSRLEVVAAVKDYDAIQMEQDRDRQRRIEEQKRQAQAEVQRQNDMRHIQSAAAKRSAAVSARPPSHASRGTGVTSAIVRRPAAPQQQYTYQQILYAYTDGVLHFNKRLNRNEAQRIAKSIIEYSNKHGLDARLVMAVIACESNFNANAVSRVGAQGLGQLMPGTAADLGVRNAFDPEANLEGSTRLLSGHIRNLSKKNPNGEVTEREIKLALACYNAGAGAVKKYGGIPPYRETRNYVVKITRLYKQMCGVKAE